jgi:hypothetical protein
VIASFSAAVVIVVAVVAAIVALWLAAALRRVRASRRAHRRADRASAGEHAAAALLRAAGYRIVARQARHVWTPIVDDRPHAIELRADYIVEADGERFVAEVKTGDQAPSLDVAATRRQLLEYRIAFEVDAVLLVCPEVEAIHRIDFPIGHVARGRAVPAD